VETLPGGFLVFSRGKGTGEHSGSGILAENLMRLRGGEGALRGGGAGSTCLHRFDCREAVWRGIEWGRIGRQAILSPVVSGYN